MIRGGGGGEAGERECTPGYGCLSGAFPCVALQLCMGVCVCVLGAVCTVDGSGSAAAWAELTGAIGCLFFFVFYGRLLFSNAHC